MSTRLDAALQKYPDHESAIRLLVARDPSGNLKYLDWGAKMLSAKQALAPEIADVVELFHRYIGQRGRRARGCVRTDINSYRPQDLTKLRDQLLAIKRETEDKRRERESLYHIEGPVEADVVYDSGDLVVRHIKNKQASAHYGLGTKWCISMLRGGYFSDYETENATFFFFERKQPVGDEFDKVALMMPRGRTDNGALAEAFTSDDERVDMMSLARVHGLRVFDIFREVYERSERYPGSTLFQIGQGLGTHEQLESCLREIADGAIEPYETGAILEAMCCNDAASSALLQEILQREQEISEAAWKRLRDRPGGDRRYKGRQRQWTAELTRRLLAAVAIHPRADEELRKTAVRETRRRRLKIENISRTTSGGRVGVSFGTKKIRRTRRRRRLRTVHQMRNYANRLERIVTKVRAKIEKREASERATPPKKARKKKRSAA